jgi:hypothetical protein
MSHEIEKRIGCVVHMEKLPSWSAGAPNDHLGGSRKFCFVRRNRTTGDNLAEFEPSNFRDGIGFVGRLIGPDPNLKDQRDDTYASVQLVSWGFCSKKRVILVMFLLRALSIDTTPKQSCFIDFDLTFG